VPICPQHIEKNPLATQMGKQSGKQLSFLNRGPSQVGNRLRFLGRRPRRRQDEPKRVVNHRSGTHGIDGALAAITLLGEEPLFDLHPSQSGTMDSQEFQRLASKVQLLGTAINIL
jgi:hypothetical protein